jgi:hypothetical protein
MDRRVAIHEAGHVLVGRALGSPIAGCTIVPGDNYSGLTWGPDGGPSKFSDAAETSSLFARITPLMPSIGEARVDVAEMITHAHARVIELVAGTEAERLLYAEAPPLEAACDRYEAEGFAILICYSSAGVDEFLAYARREAVALIEEHRGVLSMLADALIERRKLNGAEIDQIIADALAREDLAAELSRRIAWAKTLASSAAFACGDRVETNPTEAPTIPAAAIEDPMHEIIQVINSASAARSCPRELFQSLIGKIATAIGSLLRLRSILQFVRGSR